MKKILFTIITIFTTLAASAQFSAMTTLLIHEENSELNMEGMTDNIKDNIGIGYEINENIKIGAVKNGEDFELFTRYYIENIYVSLQVPTDDMYEDMKWGFGYSYNIWDNLYIEPNYSISTKEDENGEINGDIAIGISYKF